MPFTAVHNPNQAQIAELFAASKHRALRRIADHNGGYWYWPFEQATHAEGALLLKIPYDRPPGAGDVVFGD
jgi:hypothetical protein